MSKRRITVSVDEDLYIKFSVNALRKYKARKGSISKALEEAMELWLEQNKEV